MSTRQRLERNLLSAVALVCGLLCVGAAVLLGLGVWPGHEDSVLAVVWISGLVGLVTSVAACSVEDDSTERPGYFDVVRGLRREWQRS